MNTTATTTPTGRRNFWTVTFATDGVVQRVQDVHSSKANAVEVAWDAWATNDSAAVAWKAAN